MVNWNFVKRKERRPALKKPNNISWKSERRNIPNFPVPSEPKCKTSAAFIGHFINNFN